MCRSTTSSIRFPSRLRLLFWVSGGRADPPQAWHFSPRVGATTGVQSCVHGACPVSGKVRNPTGEQGFALLTVLWTLVLLSVLGTRMIAVGRTEAQLASSLREAANVEAAADGAIHQAFFHLPAARDQHWADPGSYRVAIGDADVRIEITNLFWPRQPEHRHSELLQALLSALEVESQRAASLTAAIMKWRTPGSTASGAGAKMQAYRAAGREYAPLKRRLQASVNLGLYLGCFPSCSLSFGLT